MVDIRMVYYVRTASTKYANGEAAEKECDRVTEILAKSIQDNTPYGILTVGVTFYHDTAWCRGHADADEKCTKPE